MHLTADHVSQARTLPLANHWGESWTLDELAFMEAFATERDEDIALALGRSLYAVRGIRSRLDERKATAVVRRQARRRETVITSYDEWERSFER